MSEKKPSLGVDYDPVAKDYAEEYVNELDNIPLDREWLREFAARVDGLGPICDLGCGPGQVARLLFSEGVQGVFGMDLSAEMVRYAAHFNPGIEFRQGDLRKFDMEDEVLGGIAAFYSIIHVPREKIVDVLVEWKRVLKPGGWVLVAFHIGDHIVHRDELYEKDVNLDFVFFQTEEMKKYLRQAGFSAIESRERGPYIGYEYESRRAYIFAQKEIVQDG